MTSVDTRHVERDSLFLMAEVSVGGVGQGEKAKVRNLSAGGMMVEGDLRVQRGDTVTVELRNIGPVAGSVVWVQGRRFGVAFEQEIDPKLARTQIYSGDREAPAYARPALSAPRHGGWNGRLRPV